MQFLIDFEKQLIKARNINELEDCLRECLLKLGIKTFSFTCRSYNPDDRCKVVHEFSSPNLKLWHEYYLKENYDEVDSTLNRSEYEVFPAYWVVKEQLKNAKSVREKKMRADSLKFGTEKGVSVPVRGPSGETAILMVSQQRGEECLENWWQIKFELHAIAYCFYNYLRKLLIKDIVCQHPKSRFSKRELQCLELLARNFSVLAMAKELNITQRTVNYHLQNINKKFGTHNKYKSLLKALQLGLVGA